MPLATQCLYQDRLIGVDEAIGIKRDSIYHAKDLFECTECHLPVRPHKPGGDGSAHIEHIDRNSNCSLSDVGQLWSDQEYRAAVAAYIDMRSKEAAGIKYSKAGYYKELSAEFGRSGKSYEYRMQDISYVFDLQGRNFVTGLKPKSHISPDIVGKIESMISDIEGQSPLVSAVFEADVESFRRRKKRDTAPKGNRNPKKSRRESTQYDRDPEVVDWVLRLAKGHCECCGGKAPFARADGSLFLEVHHLVRLADEGPDIIENAVAICPNCHRELHNGADKAEKLASIYDRIDRLDRNPRSCQ